MRYLALLRGVNVGGKALINMADLRDALSAAGFEEVQTYIQSGNVLFDATQTSKKQLADDLKQVLLKKFRLPVEVALFTAKEWQSVIAKAPIWWGKDSAWKHNILVLVEPLQAREAAHSIGAIKPDIENMQTGAGVIYQSLSFEKFGRTTGGKLASKPVYKQMTVRNYNTATKLLTLLTKD